MSLLATLGQFSSCVERGQRRPQQKWLRDMLAGMLIARSPMLSEIGRGLKERTRDGRARRLIHTEKRLSRGLNSDRLDDDAMRVALLERVSLLTTVDDGEGITIAVDYTDIAKPYARPQHGGMELACICYDGSTGRKGMGYPLIQMEAALSSGIHIPLHYRPFSFADPEFKSQTSEFLTDIERVSPYVGSRAIWAMDRGFDNGRMFKGLDRIGLRWIVRIKLHSRSRHLMDAGGAVGSAFDMAMKVIDQWKTKHNEIRLTFGARKVWTVDRYGAKIGKARTLVVIWGYGKDPLVLLMSEYSAGRAHALQVVEAYRRRWVCELATRAAKDTRAWGLRLEDVRALTFRGICRLVTLVCALYLFLAEVTLRAPGVVLLALSAVRTFGSPPADLSYRLLRGIGAVLGGVPRRHLERWRLR